MMDIDFMKIDICMCKNEICPLKNDCLRYTTIPSKLQPYFTEDQYIDGKCEYFIDSNKVSI